MATRRRKELEELLEDAYSLCNECEQVLILTSDPIECRKKEFEIKRLKKDIEKYEAELEVLKSLPSASSTKIEAPIIVAPLSHHYDQIIELLEQGELVLILGPGANLYGRPSTFEWDENGEYLP